MHAGWEHSVGWKPAAHLGMVKSMSKLIGGLVALLAACVALHGADVIEIPDSSGAFECARIDSGKRRLLLAHPGNRTVDIIDLKTERLLKQIKTGMAQDIAIDTRKGVYYITTGREKKLFVISRETLEVTKEIFLTGPADALCVAPDGVNRLFIADKSSTQLSVLDPNTGEVASKLPTPRGGQFLISEDDTSRVYESVASDDSVLVISAADWNSTVGGSWRTTPAQRPHGMVLDLRSPRRLFVAGANGKLVSMKADDGNVTGSANIATNVHQIAFDPSKNRVYCPGADGVLTAVEAKGGTLAVVANVEIPVGVRTVAVDPVTHAVWIGYFEAGKCFARKVTIQ